MRSSVAFVGLGLVFFLVFCASAEAHPAREAGGNEVSEEKEGWVSVDGAELHYSAQGSGPPCLVLSSIGTEPYERMMPPELSEHLRLVYVDLRGGGRSTGDPSELTFDVLAGDLESIRRDLGVERVAVLGHSILGVLAIEYGRRFPENVSHVIVVGTPPAGDMGLLAEKSSAYFEEHASEDRQRLLQENMAKLPKGASMPEIMYAQTPMRFYDARFDAAPLFVGAELRPALLMYLMGALTPGWSVTAEPASLRAPIFIALGRYDFTVPHVMWDGVAEELPDATVRVFEKSGHQPFFEEPEEFTDVLLNWMAEQR